jgi:GT2 family glycosyltransferase
MDHSPTFSLLITTRDRREDLLRTLSVMVPLLLPDNEIVVFDDGSTDGTADAVARSHPEVSLIRQSPGIGYIAARNRLLDRARGSYAISLDDDAEVLSSDFLATIAAHFEANPHCGVIACSISWGSQPPSAAPSPQELPCRVRSFVGCGHVWRLESWRSTRPYPEWFEVYGEEDYASLQLLRNGWEVHYVPSILVHHRVDMRRRPTAEQSFRYRRHFRSGVYLMCLFFPLRVLPRHLTYAYAVQFGRRILRERRWSATWDLLWSLRQLVVNLRNIKGARAVLTDEQWTTWKSTPPAVIYWKPRPSTREGTPGERGGTPLEGGMHDEDSVEDA